MRTEEYAPGRSVDLYGEPSARPVLLWHGTQTDARSTVGTLADMLAARGHGVAAPDWDSHSSDGGRSDLLRSVDHIRSWTEHPDGLILIGWSLGGVAAAGFTVESGGQGLAHTVCLAGAFMVDDPITGTDVTTRLDGDARRTPFMLLHGNADDVVPPEASRSFAVHLERAGWPVRVVELDADHGSVAGAAYDAAADRYAPAHDPEIRRSAALVTDLITELE